MGINMNNIIIVSALYGEITDPVDAVKFVKDATVDNPYFVVIGPGEYQLTAPLIMKPYVNIVGSGVEYTKLTGAISSEIPDADSSIVSGADNAILQNLTIENRGGSYYSIALHNGKGKPIIKNIAAKASGGIWSNIGILNDIYSMAIMNDVVAMGLGNGSEHCYGVVNALFSSPTMINVTANASGGKYNNKEVLIV